MRGGAAARLPFLLLAACLGACGGAEIAALAVPATVRGFAGPAAVVHDPVADVYLVANVDGEATAKDGKACISRVGPDGRVELRWIDGGRNGVELHAPRGLALAGDELFVADVDAVRVFDRASGRPLRAEPVPAAAGLRDVAVLADGTLWVSDCGAGPEPADADAVFRIAAGSAPVAVARGRALDRPAGLFAHGGGVFGVTAGAGWFDQLDRDGRRTELVRAPAAGLVGLVRVPQPAAEGAAAGEQGRWFATSASGRCIFEFDTQGRVLLAVDGLDQPGDLGCDVARQRLLVPLPAANELRILPLPTAASPR